MLIIIEQTFFFLYVALEWSLNQHAVRQEAVVMRDTVMIDTEEDEAEAADGTMSSEHNREFISHTY
jgi:hypothetical protein